MSCTQFEKSRRSAKPSRRRRPVFSLEQARSLIPLLNSILGEIVQRTIAISHMEVQARRMTAAPSGASGRKPLFRILDYSKAESSARLLACNELRSLGVDLVDGVRGICGVPTIVNGGLAYFIFRAGENEIAEWRFRDETNLRRVPPEWASECESLEV